VGRFHETLSESQLAKTEALLAPVLSAGAYAPTSQQKGGGHLVSKGVIDLIVRSRLWRVRALRAPFRKA